MTRTRVTVATLVAALSVALTGCAGAPLPQPEDYPGTWRLDGWGDVDTAPEFVVSADHTYTARNIAQSLACRSGNAATSPPGCGEPGGHSVDFSGRWEVATGDSSGIRFLYDDHFVRQGYTDVGGFAFYVRTLDAPKPDFLFVKVSAD